MLHDQRSNHFDRVTLEVEVESNENQSEIELRRMEREFELEDDSGIVDAHEVQKEAITEMMNARTPELFKRGRIDSMVANGCTLR